MRLAGLLLIAIVLMLGATPGARAQIEGLEIVEPEKVVFTISDGESNSVSVWVKNATSDSVTPEFAVVVEDDDGDPIDGLSVQSDASTPIDPTDVGRYRISLQGADSDTNGAGQLVARGDGVSPGSVPVSIGPEPNVVRGVDDALWIPAVLAVVLFVASLVIAGGSTDFTRLIPTVGFDFGKSFATTLTAVGAVFGTVLGAGVLPEETTTLSREAFTALNVLFGVAVVIAAVIPAVSQKDGGTNTRLGLFWLGAVITVWAVLGELLTLWLLVGELGTQQGFSDAAVSTFRVLLVIAAAATVIYAPFRMGAVAKESQQVAQAGLFAMPSGQRRTPML
jgi:hypothetical protein